jgi:hypothetical protein
VPPLQLVVYIRVFCPRTRSPHSDGGHFSFEFVFRALILLEFVRLDIVDGT